MSSHYSLPLLLLNQIQDPWCGLQVGQIVTLLSHHVLRSR